MKKLGKLSINPEKLIGNEELVSLRGGYDDYGSTACCLCKDGNTQLGYIVGVTRELCDFECGDYYESNTAHGFWVC